MKNFLLYTIVLVCTLLIACSNSNDDYRTSGSKTDDALTILAPVSVTKSNKMKVFAHYMPWFETPATNGGKWGQHWTMANCNPNIIDSNGKRQIASHYYPLTGPYASSDSTILDYQCLLMKYSGIDGVMIDWYGTQNKYDYASNKTNTEAIVKSIIKAGMQFAIVYEDNTLKDMDNKVSQARQDMQYLSTTFFKSDNYVKISGKPLLMIFGPQQIDSPKDWNSVFSILSTKPEFIVLNGHSSKANDDTYKNSEGEFLWVNAKPDYSSANKYNMYIAGAMPGFYDYYKLGGWGNGYTTYDAENGALFDRQLAAARNANMEWLQISTWNDYGEGTIIEPTQEFGYIYLTSLQAFTGVSYQQTNLEMIYKWYQLKMKYANNSNEMRKLKQCYYYFISLQPEKANLIINELQQ